MDDALPALEPAIERQLRPRASRFDVQREPEAAGVERPAREAVVRQRTRTAHPAYRSPVEPRARPQTSRFWTFRASVLMKSLRGPTFSPMSIVKISSARAAFSPSTRRSVRVSGFIVVSQS